MANQHILKMKNLLSKLAQPVAFVLIGTIARVLPHPANFAPIGAMALFSGTYMSKKQAFTLPILAMVISDIFVGFDSIPMRTAVYGSFLLIVGIGFWLREHKNFKYVFLSTLFGSVLFFLITNFAVWSFGSMYPRTLSGLFECYLMAIPFFRNTILGDVLYTGVFFGGFEMLGRVAGKAKSKSYALAEFTKPV
jgi:hypothetical protein